MEILILVARVVAIIGIAFLMGMLISKVKMPPILGWLLTGMILGPHALNFLNDETLNSQLYHGFSQFLECSLGLMFARELVIKKIKMYGKQIVTITLFQSFGTFLFVSLCFGVVFYFMDVPLYIALLFGAIAMATAPAPSISIVTQFKTKGPMTNTLLPLAILDDIIAIAVFFTVNAYVESLGNTQGGSVFAIIGFGVILPILLGVAIGFATLPLIKRVGTKKGFIVGGLTVMCIVYIVGMVFDNFVFSTPTINYMLLGMGAFATIANCIPEEKMALLSKTFTPIVTFGLLIMIVNLGAPLDYMLIMGAGVFTAVYIISRALGKYYGTFFGAKISKAPKQVQKYLGFAILPHSGVSLFFTSLAVASLSSFDTESAVLIQGTIAAAAVINEVIALILAKKAFEWAKEIDKSE